MLPSVFRQRKESRCMPKWLPHSSAPNRRNWIWKKSETRHSNRPRKPDVKLGMTYWDVSKSKTMMRTGCVPSILVCIVRYYSPVCSTKWMRRVKRYITALITVKSVRDICLPIPVSGIRSVASSRLSIWYILQWERRCRKDCWIHILKADSSPNGRVRDIVAVWSETIRLP